MERGKGRGERAEAGLPVMGPWEAPGGPSTAEGPLMVYIPKGLLWRLYGEKMQVSWGKRGSRETFAEVRDSGGLGRSGDTGE